jgi:hypothetical protein
MVGVHRKPLDIEEMMTTCGGFVRYFGTNEPVSHIASVLEKTVFRRVLACCGGGDQALTLLGLAGRPSEIYAFDMNLAQLFVLACKAQLFKDKKMKTYAPSFDRISRLNMGRIRALPNDVRPVDTLLTIPGERKIALEHVFAGRFGYEVDTGMHDFLKKNIYWADDARFISRIRSGLPALKGIHCDLLSLSDWFAPDYLDVIYVSDIPLHNAIPYYLERLRCLVDCLAPGGLFIGNLEDQAVLDRCPSVIEVMRSYKDLFGLVEFRKTGQILALRKVRPVRSIG